MRSLTTRLTHRYGAGPLHLLTLLASFALAGYAVTQLVRAAAPVTVLVWFLAAVVGHDLLLFPLYAIADRSLIRALHARRAGGAAFAAVPALNHIRVPALGSGLLFLIFFPGIVRQGQVTYHAATGQTQQPFLGRWLLITAAMFAASVVIYAIRLHRAARSTVGADRGPVPEPHAPTVPPDPPSPG